MSKIAYSYTRFSSASQAKGDSERRQTVEAEAYAKENGLVLDRSLKPDRGVSAYKGDNIKKGALGSFLKKVESGEIESGSTLIVESLDRVSRQSPTKALPIFLDLINSGITIVTLSDNQVYDAESIDANAMLLFSSLMVMIRANEESSIKGDRVARKWAEKQKSAAADGVKITKMCPKWLKLSDGKFVKIPDRVKVVQRIFKLALSGMGQTAICRRLTDDGAEPFPTMKGKASKAWHSSYICRILSGRQVLGEYQPHTSVNGKRVPVGEPIADYYPPIIDKKVYYQVQAVRGQNKISGSGGSRSGKLSNLFTGTAVCGYCQRNLVYSDKGQNCRYLTCPGCRITTPYDWFEESFLHVLVATSGLVNSMGDSQADDTVKTLRSSLVAKRQELQEIAPKIGKLTNLIEDEGDDELTTILLAKVKGRLSEKKSLEGEIESLNAQIITVMGSTKREDYFRDAVWRVSEELRTLKGGDLHDYRLGLHQSIAEFVPVIKVYARNQEVHSAQRTKLWGIWQKMWDRGDLDISGELMAANSHLNGSTDECPDLNHWQKPTGTKGKRRANPPLVYDCVLKNGRTFLVVHTGGDPLIHRCADPDPENPLRVVPQKKTAKKKTAKKKTAKKKTAKKKATKKKATKKKATKKKATKKKATKKKATKKKATKRTAKKKAAKRTAKKKATEK